jgi:hypothetical protein
MQIRQVPNLSGIFLSITAVVGLACLGGCAKGGNGIVPPTVTIDVSITSPSGTNANTVYVTQPITLTATVANSSQTAVTWSLNGAGTLTPISPATNPATATYAAASTAGPATITATLAGEPSVSGLLTVTVIDVTTNVTPGVLSVGNGLKQQFTAVAIPDDAPQTFTWSCTANGAPCANFTQDPNISGLAYYTAADTCSNGGVNCVQISAASTLDLNGCAVNPANCTTADVSIVASRMSGTYSFRFSGYDSSNQPVSVAGTFNALNGTISSGLEDELTANGPAAYTFTGIYLPITASDPNSNNAGQLTLNLPIGVYPNQFQLALNGAGNFTMIESDGQGSGAGVAQLSAVASKYFKGAQNYAFGFTGVDLSGKRVGYAGVLPLNGSTGTVSIANGQMDINDNGVSTCGTQPCAIAGTYSSNGNGSWHMALTSPATLNFDFFIASGTTARTSPLTFYAISTDSSAPAVSGTMVLQDPSLTYNNAAFNGTSVSALTGPGPNGANSDASLTLGTTDGKGNFSGQFDQNNAGTILSSVQFPPATGANTYTYAASGTSGRYIFQMLGDPTASPAVAPMPFVLYASGANRGFLLDQSSALVTTGSMSPQGKGTGGFAVSELPGTYAAATISSASAATTPIAANLLLTYAGDAVGGTQYIFPTPGAQAVTGTYNLNTSGVGTIALTAPSAQNYVIYSIDSTGCTGQGFVCEIQDFMMMAVDTANQDPSILFAQQ